MNDKRRDTADVLGRSIRRLDIGSADAEKKQE